MKRGILVLSVFFSLIFASAFVSAGDVAYIYNKNFKINQGMINALREFGHNVDMISTNQLPSVNLAEYEMILVGDERFSNPSAIPVMTRNSVVANYYHGDDWGLTDRDGISQMGSTSPLSVEKDNQVIRVYTEAFRRNRIAVPYYYLEKNNVASGVMGVAKAVRTSSGRDFGDVIAYLDRNGKKTCFFGIIESEFWTREAKNLFRECVNFAAQSSVPEPPPECVANSDCPDDEFSAAFCQTGVGGSNVYRNVTSYSCVARRCVASVNLALIEECQFGCQAGMCLMNQTGNQTSMIHDVGFVDFSNSINMIRLKHTNGTDILAGESLMCSERYSIGVTLENKGDFVENVSFSGSVGEIMFAHNPVENIEPDDRRLRTRTVNFTLGQGAYNISVEALLANFPDENLSDNVAVREVNVMCGG